MGGVHGVLQGISQKTVALHLKIFLSFFRTIIIVYAIFTQNCQNILYIVYSDSQLSTYDLCQCVGVLNIHCVNALEGLLYKTCKHLSGTALDESIIAVLAEICKL